MVTKYSDGFLLDLNMEEVLGEILLLVSLSIIAALYASVGHGGASGYLAILSLTAYAANDPAWLKQHAWSLNLVVAGIAYLSFRKSGFVDYKLAIPFVITSIPAALLGGYLRVDDGIYDTLLSITLVFAAWKLYNSKKVASNNVNSGPPSVYVSLLIGGIIGFLSGIIGRLMYLIKFTVSGETYTPKGYLYEVIYGSFASPINASLLYAITWILGFYLLW